MNTFPHLARAGFTALCLFLAGLPAAFAEDAAPVQPVVSAAPKPEIAVFSIAMNTRHSERGTVATATVTVLDRSGAPVPGAMVTGSWTGLTSSQNSALTNRKGKATFHSTRSHDQGDFVFDVVTIKAAEAVYNAALNAKSHDSIASVTAAEVSHAKVDGQAE